MNWFGLAGGIATVLLVAVSLFVPWWQLTVGSSSIVAANVSPIYTNFDLIGNTFTVPLMLAVNLSCILLALAGGIVMLIYSVKPMKPYAKRLLGFSYRTPLYFIVVFIIGLIALTLIIQALFGFNVPLFGSAEVQLPSSATQGVNVSVLMSAGFLWPFYLAVTSAVLCIGARLYHKRVLPQTATTAPGSAMTTVAPGPPTA
ncbi:MAG: hypothetical protein ACXV2C_05695 [Candidatus Bathyarchaeia archaeon]